MKHIAQFNFTQEELVQRFFIPFKTCDTVLIVSEGHYKVIRKDELNHVGLTAQVYDDIFESIASRYVDDEGYVYVLYLRTSEHHGNPSIYGVGVGKWVYDFLVDELNQQRTAFESLTESIDALMRPSDTVDYFEHLGIKFA